MDLTFVSCPTIIMYISHIMFYVRTDKIHMIIWKSCDRLILDSGCCACQWFGFIWLWKTVVHWRENEVCSSWVPRKIWVDIWTTSMKMSGGIYSMVWRQFLHVYEETVSGFYIFLALKWDFCEQMFNSLKRSICGKLTYVRWCIFVINEHVWMGDYRY